MFKACTLLKHGIGLLKANYSVELVVRQPAVILFYQYKLDRFIDFISATL